MLKNLILLQVPNLDVMRNFNYLAFVCWLLWLFSSAHSQPMECFNAECQAGYYCVPDIYKCRECLDCEALKRNPPPAHIPCIKSISECGSCFKGFVEDWNVVNGKCVPMSNSEETSVSTYMWLGICGAIVFLAMLIGLAVYALRNLHSLKIQASVQSPCVASAPELQPPPPYAPRSLSPAPHDRLYSPPTVLPGAEPDTTLEESSRPFIKRDHSSWRAGGVEAAGTQEAQMYDHPSYVRPPRYDSEPMEDEPERESSPVAEDSAVAAPASATSDTNGNAVKARTSGDVTKSSSGSSSGSAGSRFRRPQDTNNNCGGGLGYKNDGAVYGAGGGTSVVINVVQQQNHVKL